MKLSTLTGALCAALTLALPAVAQDKFPVKPVKLIIPFAAGGPTDVLGRIIAAKMSENMGQQVVVENRGGAGGNIGGEAVAKAVPDGYTLLLGTVATHAINTALYPKLPFDPVKDFEPVALVAKVPLGMVIHPSIPAKDLKELIAFYKANPGKYSYGSSGSGTPIHLCGELFKSMAGGLDLQHIPYRGSGPAMNDLVAGQISMICDILSTAVPHVRSGALRGIGVTTLTRSPAAPDLPTMDEGGLPGFEAYTWNAFFAPAKTPAAIVQKLNEEASKAAGDPGVRQKLTDIGVDVVTDSTPASLAAHVKAEIAKWSPVVKASGATVD
jgi:tripartite-type tricarboxylate transporter receptor subunit TctC